MIIPKLLLFVPLLLLVEAQNDPQREFRLSERLPLRRPVITPGFRPEATVPPVPNTPMTTKQVSEVFTTKIPEIVNVPVIIEEPETENPEVTYIYSHNYTESHTSSSSNSFVPTVPRQPIPRPFGSTPINKPIDNPSSSIAPPTTIKLDVLEPRLPTYKPLYTTSQYISSSPAIDVEVRSKSTEVSESKVQEPEVKKPGFTIIFSDNYTKQPFSDSPIPSVTRQPIQRQFEPINIPTSSTKIQNTVPPRLPSDRAINLTISQPDKPSYTIIIFKNDDSKQTPKEILPDVTTLNPTNKPLDTTVAPPTTYKQPDTTKIDTSTISSTTSQYTTYRPTYVPTRVPITRPSTPIFRVTDPSSTITPPPTTTSTTTRTPPTVVVTRPTPPQTPMPTSTITWIPSTIVTTRPTPPQTPMPTSTITWIPSTVFTTRPTPPQTPMPTSTTTWKPPTTVVQIWPTPPQTNVINQILDYNCRNVNGYYSVENKCDEYIICKDNNAYQNICPDGLHFDSAAKWPAFPCAYPSEVKCQDRSFAQQPQPTNECPHRYGYFPVPDGDCGRFIICQEGLATIMTCPPGLAFNSVISACDWPVNVPTCNPSAFEGFACPAMKVDKFGHSETINFRYKKSCKNYVACHEGRPRLLSCDAGFSFDEQTARCVDSSLIRSCEY